MAEELRKVSRVDYVKLGGAWRIKLIFEDDKGPSSTILIERHESPQAAERALEAAVDAENARRDREHEREMLEYLGMKPAPQG